MALSGAFRIWQFLSILKNRVQARTAANFKLRIALLLAFSVANVVLGGLLYAWIAPGEGWVSSLFTVYAVLFSIPGVDITAAPSPLATCLLNVIFIFGLLVFATILAMISDEVQSVLLAARSGRSPLVMTNHLLIVNWNKQVPFILDQLEQVHKQYAARSPPAAAAAAGSSGSSWHHKPSAGGRHAFAGRPVVILADQDKEEMDKTVISFMRQHELEVHTRTGKPYILDHLRRVSASEAAAVLVLHPGDDTAAAAAAGSSALDSGGAAALKMQTILALSSLLRGKKAAVVVQVPESSPDPSAAAAAAAATVASFLTHPGSSSSSSAGCCSLSVLDQVLNAAGHSIHLLELPVRRMINSLAVQSCLQPGVSSTYQQLLQQGLGPDLNFVHLPAQLFDQKLTTVTVTDQEMHVMTDSSSSSSSRECTTKGYSSSFLSSLSVGGLFRRQNASATAAAASSSTVTQAPVAAVAAANLAAAAPETASAVAAVAAAAADGSVAYGDVSVRYSSDLLVIGFYRAADHDLVLNPDDDAKLGPGDVLVTMTKPRGRHKLWNAVCQPIYDGITYLATLLLGCFPGSSSSSSRAMQQTLDSTRTESCLERLLLPGQQQSSTAMHDITHKQEQETAAVGSALREKDESSEKLLIDSSSSSIKPNSAAAAAPAGDTLHQSVQTAAGSSSSSGTAAKPPQLHNASSSSRRSILGFNARRRYNASKKLQQRNRALAADRLIRAHQQQQCLSSSSSRPQHVLIVGFTAAEATEDLLPHFLDFAPPGSHVTIALDAAASTAAAAGSHGSSSSSADPPGGFQAEGVLEDVEERRNNTSLVHKITYRFVDISNPTTCDGLAAAGVLEADAVLLVAATHGSSSSSSSPAESDAQVLGIMVEIQHLLALNAAAATSEQQQQQQQQRLHVVACVHSTATKAVADAFFGVPGTTAASSSSSSRLRNPPHSCHFSYELIVPGEVEAAVLVQVAHQPLYSKVVLELLGSSDGCELYLLDPSSCGFRSGDIVTFGEVQEVGRLLHKTVIGVITQGHVVLAPGGDWKWVVRESDRVAAVALSW